MPQTQLRQAAAGKKSKTARRPKPLEDPDVLIMGSRTALMVAIDCGRDSSRVRRLIEACKYPNARDEMGMSALLRAARLGLENACIQLCKKDGIDLGARDKDGYGAAHWAALRGHGRLAARLAEFGCPAQGMANGAGSSFGRAPSASEITRHLAGPAEEASALESAEIRQDLPSAGAALPGKRPRI